MAEASWNGVVLASSEDALEIENSLYFPRETVSMDYLVPTATTTRCPWKGPATYFNVTVAGETLEDAAWSYENPKARGRVIKGYVAFWKQVTISQESS